MISPLLKSMFIIVLILLPKAFVNSNSEKGKIVWCCYASFMIGVLLCGIICER